MSTSSVRSFLKRVVPAPIRAAARRRLEPWLLRPPAGWVRWGSLRRTEPVSRVFGLDRGMPVDRYYIAEFLRGHGSDIHGRVLEVSDGRYAEEFGDSRVMALDVLHSVEGNPNATIVDDLCAPQRLPRDRYDCLILTHTLQFIYDLRPAIRTLRDIAAPGGVVLAAFPGTSQISRYDMARWGEYWRLTSLAAARLFSEAFDDVEVTTYGNVMSAVALLHGISAAEIRKRELDVRDPDYEVVVCVRAVRARA